MLARTHLAMPRLRYKMMEKIWCWRLDGIIDSPEECVTQNHVVHRVHRWVIHDVSVDEEEDGQIDFFAGADLLLLEAEALDFGKVRCDLVLVFAATMKVSRMRLRPPIACKRICRHDQGSTAFNLGAQVAQSRGRHLLSQESCCMWRYRSSPCLRYFWQCRKQVPFRQEEP